MSEEKKDENLPARPASSLMGQLVRQRQASGELASTAQQGGAPAAAGGGTGVAAGQAGSGVAGGAAGSGVSHQPTRADIERIDRPQEDYAGQIQEAAPVGDAKVSANQALIREREKVIIDQLRRELDTSRLTQISEDTQAQVRNRIREMVNSDPAPLTMMEKGNLLQNVLDEVFGFGPLGPLLRDPGVGDICVNGPFSVYVERHGKLEKTPIVFENERHLRQTIDKIIQPLGRRLDDSSPMVDARLPNGSRVNATIPPVSIDGPTLTIRCFGTTIMSLGQLVEKGAMSVQMAEVLKATVKGRINTIISGGTGSGKTTLLNALSAHIGHRERIITIEDAAELRLQHDHWVRMETRPPNVEGKGQITQRMLVINALRMRPDRIILGECRGEEAFDMLQAMNTGHGGSMTTIHANSPRDCTKRLENMVMMGGVDMPAKAVRELVSGALQMIVQIRRLEDGTRRVTEVAEITGMEGDVIAINTLFHLEREGRDARGFFKCKHVGSGLPPKFLEQLEQEAVPFKLEWLR